MLPYAKLRPEPGLRLVSTKAAAAQCSRPIDRRGNPTDARVERQPRRPPQRTRAKAM